MSNEKYKLTIHTNKNAQRFYKEILAWVFGYFDGGKAGEPSSMLYSKTYDELGEELIVELQNHILHKFPYNEYGKTVGYVSGQKDHDITVYFKKDPSEYVYLFKKRMERFAGELDLWEIRCDRTQSNVEINSFELVKEIITEIPILNEKLKYD